MVKQKISTRNSNIEILRIIAMFFIVISHACVHSGFDAATSNILFNNLFVQWGVLGNLGVDIFVIITGYFLCTKPASHKSLGKLFVQLWFYSILLFLVCRFAFGYTYSLKSILTVILPTIFAEYWFFTAYVILALISPYLNILINHATKKQMEKFVLCMLAIWVLIPTFTKQRFFAGEIPQFIMFYMIGAYFRNYPDNFLKNKLYRTFLTIFSFALLFLSTFVLDFLGSKIALFQNRGIMFYNRNSLLVVGCAVGLFALSIYRKSFCNSFINLIAGCTFGVYLIHDNPAVRHLIWKKLLPLADYFDSPLLPLMILGAAIVVFSVSALIEFLRQITAQKPMVHAFEFCYNKLADFIKTLFSKKDIEK